ncbi:MAG: hypothetical protein IH886_02485 [Nitrospinae bacterium]|nr:hypothetical protein [Nitrospinota bacterium]
MKLETAFETVRILVERKKGFVITFHVSPEGETTIEKPITIKEEQDPRKIAEKLIHE